MSEKMDHVDVDALLHSLGKYGRFQMRQFLVLLISVWSCGFHLLSGVFLGYGPDARCADVTTDVNSTVDATNNNVTVGRTYGECSITTFTNISGGDVEIQHSECTNGYTYDLYKEASIVTEWDLFCGRSEFAELAQTMLMVGEGLGAVVFSSLADRFGRKPVHVGCNFLVLVLGVANAFVTNYTGFVILRFFIGATLEGLGLGAAILYMEMFPTESRATIEACGGLLFWTTGIVLMTPLAYLLRNHSWRYLQLILSAISLISLVEWWMIDESLRWLIANGKLKQAKDIIRRACKTNGKSFQNVIATCGFEDYEMAMGKPMDSTPEDTDTTDEKDLSNDGDEAVNKQLLISVDTGTTIKKQLPNDAEDVVNKQLPIDADDDDSKHISNDVDDVLSKLLPNDADDVLSKQLQNDVDHVLSKQLPTDVDDVLSKQLPNDVDDVLSKQLPNDVDDVLSKQLPTDVDDVLSKLLPNDVDDVLSKQLPNDVDHVLSKQLPNDVDDVPSKQLPNDVDDVPNKQLPNDVDDVLSKQLPNDVDDVLSKLLPNDVDDVPNKQLPNDVDDVLSKQLPNDVDDVLSKQLTNDVDDMLSKQLPNDADGGDNGQLNVHVDDATDTVEKYTAIDIFKSKALLKVSMIMWVAWITNSLTYYGIMMISTSLAGDRYLNFLLGALVEYPAVPLQFFMVRRYGRKNSAVVFHALCCLLLITATVLATTAHGSNAMMISSTVFTLLGKMAITASFSTIFLFTPELYPTNIRNAGLGTASLVARFGAVLAPFSSTLAERVVWAPGLIFGIMCAAVALMMLWVPETSKHELPQTLAECEVWYKENRFKPSQLKSCRVSRAE